VSNRNRSWKGRGGGAHPHAAHKQHVKRKEIQGLYTQGEHALRHNGQRREASAERLFKLALSGEERGGEAAFNPRTDRKTLQLCRQVERALILALAGECGDALLREVSVDSVEPAGGAGHLLVCVCVPRGESVAAVVGRLNGRAGQLRSIAASSICRKRVPMLSFVAVPAREGGRRD
jgi:ribosome-binding factor A